MGEQETNESFKHQLNHTLLPATGELAQSSAKLESYLPVALPANLIAQCLPAETALLHYESEQSYRTFRATPAGQHYGSLHFPLFNRENSRSRIPSTSNELNWQAGEAYSIVPGDSVWSDERVYFRVLLRGSSSFEEFLERIKTHADASNSHAPKSYHLLIEDDFAMEYVSFEQEVLDHYEADWQTELLNGRELRIGAGVIYDTKDSATGKTRDIWKDHIDAWDARDLDRLVEDYHDQSLVIRNDEIYVGREQIRKLFAKLFSHFDQVDETSIHRVTVNKNAIYILWTGEFACTAGFVEAVKQPIRSS